ncbi:hypothetical protein L2E82_30567 [Cichorium intybus]|uniref:Uncharacterized protein n=1 Tax=Cichorium intybus TaxID=13427 RepID=A0ACB9D0W0_CICIN|nr:hypothetical protein L2E82_30567 [Cichorium intybus]
MSSTLKMEAIRTHRRRSCNSKHYPNHYSGDEDVNAIPIDGGQLDWRALISILLMEQMQLESNADIKGRSQLVNLIGSIRNKVGSK